MISTATWQQLLDFKQYLAGKPLNEFTFGYSEEKGFLPISFEHIPRGIIYIISNQAYSKVGWKLEELLPNALWFLTKEPNRHSDTLLKQYAALLLAPLLAKRKSPFVLVHLAQTLDGKISTTCGHSKWIGNQENLTHAHRLRALVDAVLVGGNTLAADLPRLNVRHVAGPNPIRLFLSNRFKDFEKLPIEAGSQTILIRSANNPFLEEHPAISNTLLYKDDPLSDPIPDILQQLKATGIHSILVEGGAITIGSFLKAKAVDLLQFHIAPIVFGSGKSAIDLPAIQTVEEGVALKQVTYQPMGNAMMVTGFVE